MSGTLYLVATPIGNLEDITHRAVRILREADLIACEDTRQTRKLLDHYGVAKPMVSYHEHNEAVRSEELVAKMQAGASVALVSDAGMPLISDPGFRIVHAAIGAGIPVVPIPGPSALLSALVASGLPTNAFTFRGFLPAKSGQRERLLEELREDTATSIFYEAPHRIVEALGDIERILGDRPVAVARELTKLHEEILRGTAHEIRSALAARPAVKGEITLLIGKGTTPVADRTTIEDAVDEYVRSGMGRMEAMKKVARERRISKRDVYRRTQIEKT